MQQYLSDLPGSLDIPLPKTIAMVSANIAEVIGLNDRGELTDGKRADMVQVKLHQGLPVIQKVWKLGQQIS